MRVLLVTYYFPPAGGGGVQRVLGWCRHLPALGVDLTVAAPREPRWIDEDTTLVVPADVHVLRTPDPSPAAVIPRAALASTTGLVRRAWRRAQLQPRRWAVPDIHRRWRRPAVDAILQHAQERGEPWDVVVSSSPPETVHLVAHDVARALDIPWVADYRDSWLDLPHLRLDRLDVRAKHAANRRMATRLMLRACAATTVSRPLADDLQRRHPQLPVTVIANGVELDATARARSRSGGFRDAGRFVITYTGNFFGRQSARSFVDGLEQALEAEPALAEDVLIRFIGGLKPGEAARIEALVQRGVVEHQPFLRHDDVLAHQHAADLLLLYVAPGLGSAGVYTGKVFEYVAAQRPVLALVPAANVAGALLDEAGCTSAAAGGARIDPEDVDRIAESIITAWRAWMQAGGREGGRVADIEPGDEILHRISREQGAQQLHELLAAHVSTES